MLKVFPFIFLLIFLLTDVKVVAQWEIIKRLPAKPTKTLNVDVPPSIEIRAPVIWSMSFPDNFNGWAACDDGTLLRTADGGKTWKRTIIYPRVNTAIPFLATNSVGVFFINNQIGWIVAERENKTVVLGTTNAGRNWKIKYSINFRGSFHNIWFMDEKHGWAVGEAEDEKIEGGIIYATEDGGNTWNLQYADGNESFLHEIKFTDALNGWAVGEETVLHTVDGGKNWQKQNIPESAYFFGIDVLNDKEIWVVGSYGVILHTIDGGKNWSQVKLPSEYEGHWLNSVRFVNSKNGWIVGNEGAIFSTNDGGENWTLESKDKSSYLRGLAMTEKSIFSFGNEGIILQKSF